MRHLSALAFAVALLLAGLAVSTTAAPGARQSADATIAAKGFSVDGGRVGDASVSCPSGTRVVGGGLGRIGSSSVYSGRVQESGPLGPSGSTEGTESGDVATSWSASVFNPDTASHEYRVFAICSASSDATIAASSFTVSHGAGGRLANCPSGSRAIGGGVGQSGPTSPSFGSVQESAPVDSSGASATTKDGAVATAWSAFVDSSSGPREYRVFALCSATSDATIAVTSFTAGGSPNFVDATTSCGSGARAVGGGVGMVTAAPPYGLIQQSAPLDGTGVPKSTDDGDVARGWFGSVYNNTSRGYRVFALCVSDSGTQSPETTTAPPTTTAPVATTPAPPARTPAAFCAFHRATIEGTSGADVLTGTPGPDVIAGLGGNDTIIGLGGNDRICGGDGSDRILGGAGDDYIAGTAGNDRLYGGGGRDTIYGGAGRDLLRGDADPDHLYGGPDNDQLIGGAGLDLLDGGPGLDRIDGRPDRGQPVTR